jgi:hypothetical protein
VREAVYEALLLTTDSYVWKLRQPLVSWIRKENF